MSLDSTNHSALPDAGSKYLILSHPTPEEFVTISTNTSASWRGPLTLPIYLEESHFLTTVPLAKDGGMTIWILVDKNLPPDNRTILCSCESFRKRSLTSDADGNVSNSIVHGIASVFCPPPYRGRGYAPRMMKELAKVLYEWQLENSRCVGTILYSDIGKTFYAKLGWHPNPTNSHVVFQPSKVFEPLKAKLILKEDLAKLCERDEALTRKAMATPAEGVKTRMTIVPDIDHMLWHIGKEDFTYKYLFGKVPAAKGAIAGPPGKQIWAIWTHRYYGVLNSEHSANILYILRLVIENSDFANSIPSDAEKAPNATQHNEQVGYLKAVLQAAQDEAAERKLDQVKLWSPSLAVRNMIEESRIEHIMVEREEDSIASGLWYNESGEEDVAPQWVNNERYAWC